MNFPITECSCKKHIPRTCLPLNCYKVQLTPSKFETHSKHHARKSLYAHLQLKTNCDRNLFLPCTDNLKRLHAWLILTTFIIQRPHYSAYPKQMTCLKNHPPPPPKKKKKIHQTFVFVSCLHHPLFRLWMLFNMVEY